ncbi:esterase [Mangrovactinospora gilvigrisea]|uniref:Esterase n=1 Tax=Mangrovactinospora gilvigrisea TaxID=1428644 RepID=A0A1J7BXG1_9ACTN|nr:alpha/beta hydrolase-fold protein [Mangrovactinospora gilvigrisea]OIV38177.1 esterase [Mangrovactinospora gilvigrisea]
MGLTSTSFEVVMIVLTVLCMVATIVLWPRAARKSVLAVLGRIGMMVVSQLLIVGTILTAANSYFGFYSSWGDLLGTDTGGAKIVNYSKGAGVDGNGDATGPGHAVASAAETRDLTVTGSQSVNAPGSQDPAKAGRIENVTIAGPRSGISSPAMVYLPPQYFQPQFKNAKFPVIEVLTGYPGTAENLVTRLNYPGVELNAMRAGKMKPTILLMMRPTVAPPRDTEGMNVPHGPQTATYFAQDVPSVVSRSYRTGTNARSWGIIGDSTGGYTAAKLAMQYPKTFSSAVALSGYFKTPEDPTTGDLFGGSRRVKNENDLFWRLKHLPAPHIKLLVTTTKHGEDDYATTMKFIKAVKAPMQISGMVLPSGGHSFNTWSRELPQALPWLASNLDGSTTGL